MGNYDQNQVVLISSYNIIRFSAHIFICYKNGLDLIH
jgi:hypothetical protein